MYQMNYVVWKDILGLSIPEDLDRYPCPQSGIPPSHKSLAYPEGEEELVGGSPVWGGLTITGSGLDLRKT